MIRIGSKWFGTCVVLHSTHENFTPGDVVPIRWGAVMELENDGGYVSLRKEDVPDFDCWAIRQSGTDLFKVNHRIEGRVSFALVECFETEGELRRLHREKGEK